MESPSEENNRLLLFLLRAKLAPETFGPAKKIDSEQKSSNATTESFGKSLGAAGRRWASLSGSVAELSHYDGCNFICKGQKLKGLKRA